MSTIATLVAGWELFDVLIALNSTMYQVHWSIVYAHVYWLLGILLPVLFVVALVLYFLVRIRTQRARSKRELENIRAWLRKSGPALRARKQSNADLKEATSRPTTLVAWIRYQWQRLRYFGYTETMKVYKENESAHWDSVTDRYDDLNEKQRELLGGVFRSEWEAMTALLAKPRNLIPFLIGLVAPAVAFVLVEAVGPLGPDTPLAAIGLGVLGSWATYFVLACVVDVLGHTKGAYLWGSSIVMYFALNSVEVSAYPSINNYFDSQTVTVMFVCLVFLLGLPEAKSKVKAAVYEVAVDTKWEDDVDNLNEIGKLKERFWNIVLATAYFALVLHCIGRATFVILSGREIEGLISMTAVALVALLYPLCVGLRKLSEEESMPSGTTPGAKQNA